MSFRVVLSYRRYVYLPEGNVLSCRMNVRDQHHPFHEAAASQGHFVTTIYLKRKSLSDV